MALTITPLRQLSHEQLLLLWDDFDVRDRVKNNWPLLDPTTFQRVLSVKDSHCRLLFRVDFDEAADFIRTGYIAP